MVPPQTRGRGRGEDELGVYIERQLANGRNLFDVLGDRSVWAKLEDHPLLLSRVARDEGALSALTRDRVGAAGSQTPRGALGEVLPKS